MPKDRSFGYTVVEMNGDRFEIYEKKFGEPLSKVVYAFGAGETFGDLPPPPPPAPLGGRLPEGWSERLILSADASIFTGLAFHGTVLYYGTSTGELRAYDWKKQKTLWTFDLGGTVHSTPLYDRGVVIAGSIGSEIAGVDADTGKVLWRLPAVLRSSTTERFRTVFSIWGWEKGKFCKIDVKTGRKIWSWTGARGIFQAQPGGCRRQGRVRCMGPSSLLSERVGRIAALELGQRSSAEAVFSGELRSRDQRRQSVSCCAGPFYDRIGFADGASALAFRAVYRP